MLQAIDEIAITHAGTETERFESVAQPEYYEENDVNINVHTSRSSSEENINDTHPELSRRTQYKVCNLEDINPFNFTSVATLNEVRSSNILLIPVIVRA